MPDAFCSINFIIRYSRNTERFISCDLALITYPSSCIMTDPYLRFYYLSIFPIDTLQPLVRCLMCLLMTGLYGITKSSNSTRASPLVYPSLFHPLRQTYITSLEAYILNKNGLLSARDIAKQSDIFLKLNLNRFFTNKYL